MSLSDVKIRKSKPKEKPAKLLDGGGLFLALGTYPEISLADAKQRRDETRRQLAHAVKDPNWRACNRTAHLMERRKMMQLWADDLDGLKQGATAIPFKVVAG